MSYQWSILQDPKLKYVSTSANNDILLWDRVYRTIQELIGLETPNLQLLSFLFLSTARTVPNGPHIRIHSTRRRSYT